MNHTVISDVSNDLLLLELLCSGHHLNMALSLYKIGRRRGKGKKQMDTKLKKSPGSIRAKVDLDELDIPKNVEIHYPQKDTWTLFEVSIIPQIGYWAGFKFDFEFKIPDNYPYKPPKVTVKDKIYHPFIHYDQDRICEYGTNILKGGWIPIKSINHIIFEIVRLFNYGKSFFISYKDDLLLNGYMRSMAIPQSIVNLCIEFYEGMNQCIDNPILDGCDTEHAYKTYKTNKRLFEENIVKSMNGEQIDDELSFERKKFHFVEARDVINFNCWFERRAIELNQ